MGARAILIASLLAAAMQPIGLLAAAPAAKAPPPVTAPLLAWTDDPPATEVRPLSGSRTVGLRYGATLDPATFHATLDGERVSPAFHPEAGSDETVTLDFIGGRNHLVLQASSADGLTHITLERWISFAKFPGDENATARVPSAPELKHEVWKQKTPPAEPAAAPPTKP
jgi:hypothetical protein